MLITYRWHDCLRREPLRSWDIFFKLARKFCKVVIYQIYYVTHNQWRLKCSEWEEQDNYSIKK